MFDRTDLRYLDERWHEKARIAKRTTRSLDDWSDRETARWDLDEPQRKPTGKHNPRTWTIRKPLRRANSPDPGDTDVVDVRELEDR